MVEAARGLQGGACDSRAGGKPPYARHGPFPAGAQGKGESKEQRKMALWANWLLTHVHVASLHSSPPLSTARWSLDRAKVRSPAAPGPQ